MKSGDIVFFLASNGDVDESDRGVILEMNPPLALVNWRDSGLGLLWESINALRVADNG